MEKVTTEQRVSGPQSRARLVQNILFIACLCFSSGILSEVLGGVCMDRL